MELIVFVKRVPDTASQIRVGPDGRSLDTNGLSWVVNPYDEFAVEECLRLKEKHGGSVTVVTVGPKEATKELRQCLAMGADGAIHVVDEEPVREPLQTAAALKQVLEGRSYDLLFFGKQAVDHDHAQTGLLLAAMLGLPAVGEVVGVEIADGTATVKREAEGGVETWRLPLPCVLTAQKGLNEPRYPNLRSIMLSKKKPLEEVTVDFPEAATEVVRMEPPPPRPPGRIVGEGKEAVPELVRLLREEAKVL